MHGGSNDGLLDGPHAGRLTRPYDDACNPPLRVARTASIPDMTSRSSNDPPAGDTAQAIIDASDARVFRVDRDLRLTWSNRALRRRHGLAEGLGGSLAEVFDAQKRAVLLRPLQRALAVQLGAAEVSARDQARRRHTYRSEAP